MADLNNIADKVKDVSKEAAHEAKDIGSTIKENALEVGGILKDKATDLGQETMSRALNAQDYLLTLVRDHPYTSLGVAFFSGWFWSKCRIGAKNSENS